MLARARAQINSGNSGGPAFDEEGACIGIAFQSLKHEDAENIGYVARVSVSVRVCVCVCMRMWCL